MKETILSAGDSFDIARQGGVLNAAGQQIAKDLGDYVQHMERFKSRRPQILRVSRKHAMRAGWTASAKKKGIRADFITLKLTYAGIPVELC